MGSSDSLCGLDGARRLTTRAFGPRVRVARSVDVGGGRGTFSDVFRLELAAGDGDHAPLDGVPDAVVAKLPTRSVNREAAARNGAYRREHLAYRYLLADSPIATPSCLTSIVDGSTAAFLLDDLTPRRFVDQIDGLGVADATSVAGGLARFHHHWRRRLGEPTSPVARHRIRGPTVADLSPDRLTDGLDALRNRWADIGPTATDSFAQLVDKREALVEQFVIAAKATPTLCHGDPRADNLCFSADNSPVLFDWQQVAVQFGEADLAWLTATSLTAENRRAAHDDIVAAYGADIDRLRLGFVLPGLAALLLAQRNADHPRTRTFIATSLTRIAACLGDYEVARLG